jgi:hypothetical protein
MSGSKEEGSRTTVWISDDKILDVRSREVEHPLSPMDKISARNQRPTLRQIAGFSLSPQTASEVKAEATRRQLSLRKLFEEMWALYKAKIPAKRGHAG